MGFLCGQRNADGTTCRRPVARRGSPCGATHSHLPAAGDSAAFAAASGPGLDPLAGTVLLESGRPPVDGTAALIPPDMVVVCGHAPTGVGGGKPAEGWCQKAVLAPADRCHRHGGPPSPLVGSTYEAAAALAARGELRPVSGDWWDSAEARYAALTGQAATVLVAPPDRDSSGISNRNRLFMMMQYRDEAEERGLDDVGLVTMVREPHMTAEEWAGHGRRPAEGAEPVVVTSHNPGDWVLAPDFVGPDWRAWLEQKDEKVAEALRQEHTLLYRMSATEGDDYTPPAAHHDLPIPTAEGADPNLAVAYLVAHTQAHGGTVTFAPDKEVFLGGAGFAWGSAEAARKTMTVWAGVGGGDPASVAHAAAHERGHLFLEHGLDSEAETRTSTKEIAAETFAYLVCNRFGIDSSAFSADYIARYRRDGDLTDEEIAGAVRSAVVAADTLFAELDDPAVDVALAENRRTPPDVLVRLAAEPFQAIRINVANNPNTPPETLTHLAADPREHVRRNVADNPNTPAETLAALAADTDDWVRRYVADNPNTPAGTLAALAALAADPHPWVRERVAANPNTPPDTLAHLAADDAGDVRERAAGNPNTPPGALAHLAADPDTATRKRVAGNRHTPPGTLARLIDDPDSWVRWEVANNPNTPPATLTRLAAGTDDIDAGVRMSVADNPSTPAETLTGLAGDGDWRVRRVVADNPNTPAGTLAALAADPSWNVRKGVADNLTTPAGALTRLAGDPDRRVREAAQSNPGCPRAGSPYVVA